MMKTKTKPLNNSKKQITKILGLGKIDFHFFLELQDSDESDLDLTIENIDSLEKLKFLSEKPEYWDKISMTSNSPLINTFLYINRVSKHKTFIEFASLAPISYSDEEMFLKPIITYVSEHNFLFINENDIVPFYKTVINFSVKKGTQVMSTFNLCQNDNINSSVNHNNSVSKEKNVNEEDTIYDKLVCDYSQFNYLFLDLNEFVDMNAFNVGFSDVLNLLSTIDKYNKDINFYILFSSILSNQNLFNIDSLNQLSEILSYADCVMFDRKEAMAYYNIQHQLNNNTSTSSFFSGHGGAKSKSQFKTIVEKNFLSGSYRRKWYKRNSRIDRLGIFLDDLNTITLVQGVKDCPEDCLSQEYRINIIPKCNNANKKLVEEYKRQYELNKPFLNSVFLGGFLSKIINNGGYEYSLFIANEITKRCMDLFKLELEFPLNNEFYYVSTKKSYLLNNYEKKQKQEKGFVLDCTNVVNSKLNEYNPLFDNNLSSFFNSEVVRKHLNNQGFINTRGFLLLDTKHKKNSLLIDKSADKVLKRDKNIMIAVKENSNKMNQENLERMLHYKSKALNDPSITQLEMLAHTLNYSPLKNKQLPIYSDTNYYKPQGKMKLQPLTKEYNKTSQNMSYKQTEINEDLKNSTNKKASYNNTMNNKSKLGESTEKIEDDEEEKSRQRKLEKEKLEKEKLEKQEKERIEKEKAEKEKAEKAEKERKMREAEAEIERKKQEHENKERKEREEREELERVQRVEKEAEIRRKQEKEQEEKEKHEKEEKKRHEKEEKERHEREERERLEKHEKEEKDHKEEEEKKKQKHDNEVKENHKNDIEDYEDEFDDNREDKKEDNNDEIIEINNDDEE